MRRRAGLTESAYSAAQLSLCINPPFDVALPPLLSPLPPPLGEKVGSVSVINTALVVLSSGFPSPVFPVLMPEHFHLLLWPSERADPSHIVQSRKERTAKFMVKNFRLHPESRWCAKMLAALTLPPTVHLHGPHRVWQGRFYDLNVWSPQKRDPKLAYMHGNPVARRLVASPDQRPWSSFRFYFLEDSYVLPMDPML